MKKITSIFLVFGKLRKGICNRLLMPDFIVIVICVLIPDFSQSNIPLDMTLTFYFEGVPRSHSWAVNQWQTTAKKGETGTSLQNS